MSDHGFGPCTNVRIRANQVFERNKLLSFQQERSSGRAMRGLAGSLDRRQIEQLLPTRPDWFAVRGAACGGDGRTGTIDEGRVRELARLIAAGGCVPPRPGP